MRYIDLAIEALDEARESLMYSLQNYNTRFPNHVISEQELDKLMDFFRDTRLFIIPYTISRTDRALNDEKSFQELSLYIGMKTFATGIEDYLRELVLK